MPPAHPPPAARLPGSFRTRLALWFGGLSLLSIAGLDLYAGQAAIAMRTELGGQQLRAVARHAAERLATQLGEREKEIDLLRRSPFFTDGAIDSERARLVLEDRQAATPAYAWLGITDVDGRVMQATGQLLQGQSVARRPWFQQGRQALYTGDVHDAVLLARLLPAPEAGQPMRFLDIAAPILDKGGRLRGVLGAHAHWSWVTETLGASLLRDPALRGLELMVADAQGRLLHPFQPMGDPKAALPALPDAQGPAMALARDSHARLPWPDGVERLTSIVRLPATARSDLGWQIVARQPLDAALAPVTALRNRLLLAGLLTAGLLALLAHRLAVRLSRPLEQLSEAAARVRDGGPATPFAPLPTTPGTREVALLAASVESMTQRLLEREQHLAELNASLEATVADRTRHLFQLNQELERIATVDALTGVANRRRFDERLHHQFLMWQRHRHAFGLLVIDADHFKQVNDRHGHPVGDAVLRQLAALIVAQVRETDLVARFGGEEFVVLLSELNQPEAGAAVAEKLRAAIAAASFPVVGRVTVSIGVGQPQADDLSETSLLQRADQALYRAKQAGRNRWALAPASATADADAATTDEAAMA